MQRAMQRIEKRGNPSHLFARVGRALWGLGGVASPIDPARKEPAMAKGQRRSNREVKKPKQPKSGQNAAASAPLAPAFSAREGTPAPGRDRAGGRNGRK